MLPRIPRFFVKDAAPPTIPRVSQDMCGGRTETARGEKSWVPMNNGPACGTDAAIENPRKRVTQGRSPVVINTNTAAQSSARLLAESSRNLAKSLARLSSGSQIISPADDAAGAAAALRFEPQVIRSLHVPELPEFDVLIGGIPCTSHSNLGRAKKGLAGKPELGDTGDLFLPALTPVSTFLDPPYPEQDRADAERIARTIEGLRAHNSRHRTAGHGFEFSIVNGSEIKLPTVPNSYHKINSGSFVQTPFGSRWLRQQEIERIDGCEIRTQQYSTAVQMLGQGVPTRVFRQVFKQIGNHLAGS